jgi:hypothetical protein
MPTGLRARVAALVIDLLLCLARMFATTRKVGARDRRSWIAGDRSPVIASPSPPTVRATTRRLTVEWRPPSIERSSWYPARTTNGMLTRSPAWLPATLVLACLSAGGIGAYR